MSEPRPEGSCRPIEVGLRVVASRESARIAASRIDGVVDAAPWLRVASVERTSDRLDIRLVATLGSREAIKAAEPEVQVVLGGLADLMDDLAPYAPCFTAPTAPESAACAPGAVARALGGEAA